MPAASHTVGARMDFYGKYGTTELQAIMSSTNSEDVTPLPNASDLESVSLGPAPALARDTGQCTSRGLCTRDFGINQSTCRPSGLLDPVISLTLQGQCDMSVNQNRPKKLRTRCGSSRLLQFADRRTLRPCVVGGAICRPVLFFRFITSSSNLP